MTTARGAVVARLSAPANGTIQRAAVRAVRVKRDISAVGATSSSQRGRAVRVLVAVSSTTRATSPCPELHRVSCVDVNDSLRSCQPPRRRVGQQTHRTSSTRRHIREVLALPLGIPTSGSCTTASLERSRRPRPPRTHMERVDLIGTPAWVSRGASRGA